MARAIVDPRFSSDDLPPKKCDAVAARRVILLARIWRRRAAVYAQLRCMRTEKYLNGEVERTFEAATNALTHMARNIK